MGVRFLAILGREQESPSGFSPHSLQMEPLSPHPRQGVVRNTGELHHQEFPKC